ncbi:MAG: hypothetical protein AOA65_0531 [Candidatus Bathyarchaeota archaeon BA1]|nr:MAG: hypothetical protein AOA65_0531 [Candidatus Bathyarchaeota archaeon BA1]
MILTSAPNGTIIFEGIISVGTFVSIPEKFPFEPLNEVILQRVVSDVTESHFKIPKVPPTAEVIISIEEALEIEPPFERLAIPEKALREWVRDALAKAGVTTTIEVEDALVRLVAHTIAKIEEME